MTAVIGILNKSAAAIATDSAVTVTGPRGSKIFNSANKIFRISKYHPVGMIIYNQGEFMGTPWEIIAKQYRKESEGNTFDTLEEYKNDFIEFLHKKQFYCDIQQQKMTLFYMLCDLLQVIGQEVYREQQSIIQSQPHILQKIIADAIDKKIEDYIKRFEAIKEYCPEFEDFTEKEFDDFGFTGLPNAIQQIFVQNGVAVNVPKMQPALKRLTYFVLKSKNFFNFFSGIVFTGFGDKEMFPSLIPLNISNAINGRLRYFDYTKRRISIGHQMMSAICPFAQTDVIDTVLSGIDPRLNRLYYQQFQDFIVKNNAAIAQLVEKTDPQLAGKIKKLDAAQLTQALNKMVANETRKHYIDPLMGAVSTLSKEDLAEMAESLIYLTYLKRRFTFAQESVGGPVDVAIITKGDGFVWIKRKHYFKPELNHHFLKYY
jgi:hypothetical protein